MAPAAQSSIQPTANNMNSQTEIDPVVDESQAMKKLSTLPSSPIYDHHGLKLNDAEPWERSLSRMLLKARTMPSSHNTKHSIPNVNSHTATSELLWLGRSDSRDFAFEIEGSDSNPPSNFSSRNSSPLRNRNIYRSPPPGSQSILDSSSCSFDDDGSDDEAAERNVQSDHFSHRFPRRLVSMGISNRSCSCTSTGTNYTNTYLYETEARGEVEVEDREVNNTTLRHASNVDGRRSFSIRRARALHDEDDPMDWLLDNPERDLSPLMLPDLRLPLL